MFQILVVEDDKNTARLMRAVLTHADYEVFQASNGQEALDLMDSQHVDLILLDVMMPVMDGYEFTDQLRKSGDNTPILMVTARQLPEEKCRGFLVGTDDYMVKPIDIKELVLRVNALLRRSKIANERQLKIADVTLDAETLQVTKGEDAYTLSPKEFNLLFKLLSYPGRVFTRFEIMSEVWGYDSESDEKTINVHISKLRTRFEGWPEFEILTVRGLGYKAIVKDDLHAAK